MSFFDHNTGPLLEDEPGPVGQAVKAAAEGVAGLMAEGEPTSTPIVDNTQGTDTEATSKMGASTVTAQRTLPRTKARKRAPVAGKKGPFNVQIAPPETRFTIPEAVVLGQLQARERAFLWAKGQSDLKASQASVTALKQWEEINQNDYEGRQELINEAFPKWRRQNEQLSQDIDDARMLKVNPHNYLQSIGRAGRVASVLAVGIGQLAAGAGNSNSVYTRFEAAMKRDIAAQKDNIAQAWKGIEMKRELNQDEIDLLETQFNFEDRASAVGYAALAARLGAAKQHAKSENIRLNFEMIESRALASSIIASGTARAKATSVFMDTRVHSVHAAMKRVNQMAELQTRLQGADLGDARVLQAGADVLSEPLTGAPAQEAPGVPAAAPTPQEQPVTAPPKSAAASVSRDRRRAPAAATAPGTGPLSNEALAVQDAPQGPPEAPTAKSAPAVNPTRVRDSVGDVDVTRHGSFEGAAQFADNVQVTAPTLDQMTAHINSPGVTKYAIAGNIDDAGVLARELKMPDRNDPVFTNPKTGKVNEAEYQARVRHVQNLKKYPEAFLRELPNWDINENVKAVGHNNVIDMGDGTFLHIKADKKGLLQDDKARSELEIQVRRTYLAADQLAEAAISYQQSGGAASIMGIKIDSDNGLTWVPGDADQAFLMQNVKRIYLGTGIEAIKALDEGGRLSDADVGFGMQLVSTMNESVPISLDMLTAMYQQHFGKPGDLSAIRLAAGKVFGAAIKNYLHQLDTFISPLVVPSTEAVQMMQDRAGRVDQYIVGSKERFDNQIKRNKEERLRSGETILQQSELTPEQKADFDAAKDVNIVDQFVGTVSDLLSTEDK